jgi:hypothetical protein
MIPPFVGHAATMRSHARHGDYQVTMVQCAIIVAKKANNKSWNPSERKN